MSNTASLYILSIYVTWRRMCLGNCWDQLGLDSREIAHDHEFEFSSTDNLMLALSMWEVIWEVISWNLIVASTKTKCFFLVLCPSFLVFYFHCHGIVFRVLIDCQTNMENSNTMLNYNYINSFVPQFDLFVVILIFLRLAFLVLHLLATGKKAFWFCWL